MTTTVSTRAMAYAQSGYLPATDVFTGDEVRLCRAQFETLEARVGPDRARSSIQNWHFDEEFIWRMATHPRVLDVIEELAGPNLLLFNTRFFVKFPEPDAKFFFAWHQDSAYAAIEPQDAHVAWIAIDDSDAENGCLRVIPGTHTSGVLQHARSGRAGNMLRDDQEVPPELLPATLPVDLPQRAGQMSVHHVNVFHGSSANRSGRRRCGFAASYASTAVRQSRELLKQSVDAGYKWQPWRTTLVRGRDDFGHFKLEPPPFPFPGIG